MTSIEFAKMIGVSQSMVSRAMNDSPLVSSEKREYIKKKAMEYGFVLNSQAQSLRTKRTGTVAILIPEHFKGMSISIGLACFYDAIEKELVKYGYDIMVIYDKGVTDSPSSVERIIKAHKVDGFIDIRLCSYDNSKMKQYNIPCVYMLNASARDLSQSICISDSEYGGYLAVKFLSRYRAYRPVYINVTATTDSIARKNGYIRGLQENGLELSPDDILDADLSIKGGYECVMQNKSVFMGKIALFAFNDLVGIGVINACHELGIRIGEDIQIVGMDAISIAKEISPRLTTIDIRLEELARIGCEMLRDSIESKDSPVRSEIIRPVLCLGETTADI